MGVFLLFSQLLGKKKNLCGKTYVRRIPVFIVDSMSTLVRLSGSDIPETGGVIILNFACSESRLERKWEKPGAVKDFDFSSGREWVPIVKEPRGSNLLCLLFCSISKCCTYVKQSPSTMKASVLYLITVSQGSSESGNARIGWLFNGACQGNWLQMGKWGTFTPPRF